MKELEEIISNLRNERYLEKHSIIPIWDSLSIQETEKFKKLRKFNELEIYLGSGRLYSKIDVGKTFDIIFPSQNPEYFENIKAELLSIIFRQRYFDSLDEGHSGICLFKFEFVPKLFDKLKPYEERMDFNKFDKLYLTQKPLFEKILKSMNT